jgi:hypothetical protein
MEKAAKSLKELGLEPAAEALRQQMQKSILQIEKRQQFALTLAESDDYPRQPDPTESTLVRDLRDEIAKGDALIQGVRQAASALSAEEIDARVRAIQQRQARLNDMLKRQREALGGLYALPLTSEASLREALAKTQRLRDIFVGTPDEREVSDMVVQLERMLAAVSAWETGDVSVERLSELLRHYIENQLPALNAFLAEQEIESPWDLAAIFQALASERIHRARRRSADWVQPRQALSNSIDTGDEAQCRALEQELAAAPGYLSDADRLQVTQWLDTVRGRRALLEDQARRARFQVWWRGFAALGEVSVLDRYETERLLKALRHPPDELRPEEQATRQPLVAKLTAHLDQISMDEMIVRIEQLPTARQHQLLAWLVTRLGG